MVAIDVQKANLRHQSWTLLSSGCCTTTSRRLPSFEALHRPHGKRRTGRRLLKSSPYLAMGLYPCPPAVSSRYTTRGTCLGQPLLLPTVRTMTQATNVESRCQMSRQPTGAERGTFSIFESTSSSTLPVCAAGDTYRTG